MSKKIGLKKTIVLFMGVLLFVSAITFGVFPRGNVPVVYSEVESSADAGTLSIKDDFRFCGLDGKIGDTFFISADNVCTDEYGSYTYGLIPAVTFGEQVDVSDGHIIYTVSLDGNGEFLLVKTLFLRLGYSFITGYNPSLKVSYSLDNQTGDYTELAQIVPDSESYGKNLTSEIDFNDVLNNADLNAEKLYVKISLIHDAVIDINIEDVSVRLFFAELYGMHNFSMKKGAGLRLSSGYNGDLVYRAFIAKDCFDALIDKYGNNNYSIILGNIILPAEYITRYDARLERDNIRFEEKGVKVGRYPDVVASTVAKNLNGGDSPYTITANGVEYYYFDGYISRIKTHNLTRDFMSKSYIRILNKRGDEVLFSLAAFKNQDINDNSRSAVYVSQKLIEKNGLLRERLKSYYIDNMADNKTSYTVRKFYIGNDFNVVSFSETVFSALTDEKIILTEEQKSSGKQGFTYIGDNVEIKDGETVIYRNSFYDRVYPFNKLVIDLYYKAI